MKTIPTKTTTRHAANDPLTSALESAEMVLEQRGQVFARLSATHEQIPVLLRQQSECERALASAEMTGRDVAGARAAAQSVQEKHAASIRQRHGAIEALTQMEPDLIAARDSVDAAREAYAAEIVEDFRCRYAAAVELVQELQREASALAAALRTPIDAPPPGRVESGASPIAIDPRVARIGGILDALHSAIGFPDRMRALRDREMRRERSGTAPAGFVAAAKFMVLHEFNCPITGLQFVPGMIVDDSLLSATTLARLYGVRYLRYADRIAGAAA